MGFLLLLLLDEVRTGTYRQLFHPEQLITGKEDAGKRKFFLVKQKKLIIIYSQQLCPWSLHHWKGNRRSRTRSYS
jgi:hypothetical protein